MKLLTALFGVSTVALATAHAQGVIRTLTFDDVSPNEYVIIQNGYGGWRWNNFYIQNALNAGGFYSGMVSPANVAFNGLGNPASISSSTGFTLLSASLTAVYVNTEQIRVQGFTRGTLTYNNTYGINNNGPTLINFNYVGVDEVRFIPPAFTWFAMDNLNSTVPEPNTTALMSVAATLAALGVFRKKIKNWQPA